MRTPFYALAGSPQDNSMNPWNVIESIEIFDFVAKSTARCSYGEGTLAVSWLENPLSGTATAVTVTVADGVYLVQVQAARHQWDRVRPFYSIRFSVVAPKAWAGGLVAGRIWCTPKALWKLRWFLRDFGYDPDLIDRDEIDDKRLVELRGVLAGAHRRRSR
jgi:hypothetical protein